MQIASDIHNKQKYMKTEAHAFKIKLILHRKICDKILSINLSKNGTI